MILDYLERRMLSCVIDRWGNLHCMRQEPKSEIETASVADSGGLQGHRKISCATSHLSASASESSATNCEGAVLPGPEEAPSPDSDVLKTAAAGLFQNVSNEWVSLRKKSILTMPNSTDASDPLEDEHLLPSFNPQWKTEFEETQVHAFRILLMAALVGPPLIYVTYFYLLAEEAARISSDGGWEWATLQWSGYCMVILIAFFIFIFFTVPWGPLQRFSVKYFELLAATAIVLSLTGTFWTTALTELRRSTFHERLNMFDMENSELFQNLTYSIDRSGVFPRADCYDSSAPQTLLSWESFDEPGCSSRLVYGTTVTNFIAIVMFSHVLHLSSKRAIQINVLIQIFCIITCLVVGKHALSMWATLLLIGIAGMVDALHCHLKRQSEMQEFIQTKVHKFASSSQRALLYTLIPANVLDNMRGPEEGVCTEIRHVTMMFCSFDLDVSTKKDFDFLDCVLEALDKSVLYSGMHKYQHVSCGNAHYYIVGCPRIACPFDVEEQSSEYPRHYSVNMIQLGRQLSRIVSKFAAPNRPLHMKIGINCGPVASVVLGKCRRYYCVYGNTGSLFFGPTSTHTFIHTQHPCEHACPGIETNTKPQIIEQHC